MPDLSKETPVSFSQATKHFPGNPTLNTLYRWKSKGVNGVCLESFACGGRRFTTEQAIARFLVRTTAAADARRDGSTSKDSTRRNKVKKAKEELAKAGI